MSWWAWLLLGFLWGLISAASTVGLSIRHVMNHPEIAVKIGQSMMHRLFHGGME